MRASRRQRGGHLFGLPQWSSTVVVMLAGLSALLAGCGQNLSTVASAKDLQGAGAITLALSVDSLTTTVRSQLEQWNHSHADQQVTVVELPSGAAARNKLAADAAAGTTTADVIELPISEVASFASQDLISPLSARQLSLDALPGSVRASIEPFNIIYAAPMRISVNLLYYRADILEAAGLTAPTTWEDVKNQCAQVATPAQLDCFGLPMSDQTDLIQALTDAVSSSDGVLVDDRGNPQADTAQAQEGISALKKRLSENTITAKSLTEPVTTHRQDFLAGKLLFLRDTVAAGPELAAAQSTEARVGVAALPSEHGGGAVTVEGSALGISSNAEHQQTAMALIAYLTSLSSSDQHSLRDGAATAYPQRWQEEITAKHPALAVARQVIAGAKQAPPVTRYASYRAAVCGELKPVLQQKLLPSYAAERLQNRLEASA